MANKMLNRDVKRRVNVIQSKIKDLQKMGVPCVFAYSTSWTGGLYVCGDERMTRELKSSSDNMLHNLREDTPTDNDEGQSSSNFCLPRLPGKLSKLNSKTITSMLTGLGKDLGINWKGAIPSWWPENIPFQHPREAAPEEFKDEFGKYPHQLWRSDSM